MKQQKYEEIEKKENIYYEIDDNKQPDIKKENRKDITSFKKTIAYIHIDSTRNETIQQQRYISDAIINEFAYNHNLEVTEYFIDCVPQNTDLDDRVCLKKMLEAIKKNDVGQILIANIDHISKSSGMLQYVLECISKTYAKIVCCTGGLTLG